MAKAAHANPASAGKRTASPKAAKKAAKPKAAAKPAAKRATRKSAAKSETAAPKAARKTATRKRAAKPAAPEPAAPATPFNEESFSEQVARLAYQFWLERGRPDGSAHEDWFRAEQELSKQG